MRRQCRFDLAPVDNSKVSPSPQRKPRVSKSRVAKEIAPEPDLEFGAILGNNELTLTLPLRTLSPNQCEPWRKRHARHKEQKRAVILTLGPYKEVLKMPCTIRCVRYAPKAIDSHDNLPYSFKNLVDTVTAQVSGDYRPGRADGHEGFSFEYDQVKSKKYAVKIIIRW